MVRAAAAALVLLRAGLAVAEEPSQGDARPPGPRGRAAVSLELLAERLDLRALSFRQAPPLATPLDDDAVERRQQYALGAEGLFVRAGVATDAPVPFRAWLRVGVFEAELSEESRSGNLVYTGTTTRTVQRQGSLAGLAGGVGFEARQPFKPGPLWVGAGYEFLYGAARLDQAAIFGDFLEGDLTLLRHVATARAGATVRGSAVWVGLGAVSADVEADEDRVNPVPGAESRTQAKFRERNIPRIVLGTEFGTEAEASGRIEIALWNPAAEWTVSVAATLKL
ncbi:MAG: hypothetical protein L0216_15610 [Planctomycetales bacterium]|nr:hypothetical protein [Planctomycetales bacterium]